MRWPRVRFTVRWLMVAVAIAGLALTCYRRRQEFRKRALIAEIMAYFGEQGRLGPAPQPLIDYHRAMERKYERAARYPWLPVEPDPPKPK